MSTSVMRATTIPSDVEAGDAPLGDLMKQRGIGQKAARIFAYLSYSAAFIAVLGAAYWAATYSTSSPIFSSLAASVVFFGGCGVVLHVIGSADLPDLRIDRKR